MYMCGNFEGPQHILSGTLKRQRSSPVTMFELFWLTYFITLYSRCINWEDFSYSCTWDDFKCTYIGLFLSVTHVYIM